MYLMVHAGRGNVGERGSLSAGADAAAQARVGGPA
jgi:hypothetical protein